MILLPRVALALLVATALFVAWQVHTGGALRAQFDRDVAAGRAREHAARYMSDTELVRLPEQVQRYLVTAATAGAPYPQEYRVRFRGRLRSGPAADWMPVEVEQVSFTDPPARLFFLRATMKGLPVIGLHRLVNGHATMDIRLFGLIPVMQAAGPLMDRAESVTLLNDMAVLAPPTLLDPAITWRELSFDSVAATFRHAGQTVQATLVFGSSGRLLDFVSDDRAAASPDGKHFTARRWSTPVRDYIAFGPHELASRGAARWHLPEGAFDYAQLEMLEVVWLPRE
ncbi:MAG: hypothetical protein KAY61_02895 [Candidatus Eisenbacteria bacterium]|nr:hypothetical protein [Candidatus Eisenbacteria bacterium]